MTPCCAERIPNQTSVKIFFFYTEFVMFFKTRCIKVPFIFFFKKRHKKKKFTQCFSLLTDARWSFCVNELSLLNYGALLRYYQLPWWWRGGQCSTASLVFLRENCIFHSFFPSQLKHNPFTQQCSFIIILIINNKNFSHQNRYMDISRKKTNKKTRIMLMDANFFAKNDLRWYKCILPSYNIHTHTHTHNLCGVFYR